MDIVSLFRSFQTQEQAVEYLERARWGASPFCPYCRSGNVGPHASGDRKLPRWQCRDCTRAYSATVGTLFQGTHIPLRTWFLVLALMLRATRPASAYRIARDLGIRRPTVWRMMKRLRTAMQSEPEQNALLRRLVEATNEPNTGLEEEEDLTNGVRDHAPNALFVVTRALARSIRRITRQYLRRSNKLGLVK